MERSEMIEKIAPCSLVCHTCSGYCEGVISGHSKELLKYLEGVKEFYQCHIPNEVENYTNFENTLKRFASSSCSGCRKPEHRGCSITGCFILECTKEHGIDFCGECSEFPCKKVSSLFEDVVYKQWLSGNAQIKGNGIEAFWKEASEKPHYLAYKHTESMRSE